MLCILDCFKDLSECDGFLHYLFLFNEVLMQIVESAVFFTPQCIAYVPQIVAALAHGLDPQKVCTEVKLCTGKDNCESAVCI